MQNVGPLHYSRVGDTLSFTVARADLPLTELPSNYEGLLADQLHRQIAETPALQIVMDLEDTPAISSRQLGVMLALHKALRPHRARLPLTRVSSEVRQVLETTRTARFFEFT